MNKTFALICVAPVRVHAVYVVVVCLRIVFSKAALQKRGSMEPIETLLPPQIRHCMRHNCTHLSTSSPVHLVITL